jgi:plastocyanin
MRALVLGCALAILASRALAGTVEGSVALGSSDLAVHSMSHANPYVGQLSSSAKPNEPLAAADTACGVAWIDDQPAETGPPPASVRMDQIDQRFVPRVLAIVAGQTVEFHNSDNVYHNIFSYSPPKKFDLGRYPKGKSRSVTFVKPGAVQVYCDIHSDMRADIIVAPTRRYAMIGPSGRFRIEDVASGTRRVRVWLPSGERSAAVLVPAQGTVSVPTLLP